MYKNILSCLVIAVLLLSGCRSARVAQMEKHFGSPFYNEQFTGFALYDPHTGKNLYEHQANRYFTPASNTKIFTLYTALHLLPDSIPALRYAVNRDTLYIEGTGDPTLLHPYFGERSVLDFLEKRQEPIALYTDNFYDDKFGPGWAWSDYAYYYSPERSAFPVYGNVISVFRETGNARVIPGYFGNALRSREGKQRPRALAENIFYLPDSIKDTLEIPFITSPQLLRKILSDTLKKEVHLTNHPLPEPRMTLYSIPADSLYRRMMLVSDNFLAEQILLMSAAAVSDSLKSSNAREYILEKHLPDLPQKPRWVDGSGLSRYNLFSPASMVHILDKLYQEQPKERLFSLFPAGGQSGTLKNFYKNENASPYVYAKSGTLSNNHNLSGYILTKSGKVLIFSYMNNHYTHPTSEVRKQMETLFRHIRDKY